MSERQYVLGTHDEELERLGLQHRAWRVEVLEGFARAGFRPGQSLCDLGAGPGYVTFDLAELVGPSGRIIAVDLSERFLAHLRAGAAARGLTNIEIRQADAEAPPLAPESLDGAWARWLFTFLPRPERAMAAVARALAKGAPLLVHEYAAYDSMRLGPRSAVFEKAVQAVMTSWRHAGGEPNIALALPELGRRYGLELEALRPLATAARPGELRWLWGESFFHSYLPTLVQKGLLSESDVAELWRDWQERKTSGHGFFNGPQVLEIVLRKS